MIPAASTDAEAPPPPPPAAAPPPIKRVLFLWEFLCLPFGDFVYEQSSPSLALPVASVLFLFSPFMQLLLYADIGLSSPRLTVFGTFSPLFLQQYEIGGVARLPLTAAASASLLWWTSYAHVLVALLALLSTSAYARPCSPLLAPLAALAAAASLVVDVALNLPALALLKGVDFGPGGVLDPALPSIPSLAAEAVVLFLLKLSLLLLLLFSKQHGERADTAARLWAAADEALQPEPAFWALAWGAAPRAAALQVARGGCRGALRSLAALVRCAPLKLQFAGLLTVTVFAIATAHLASVFEQLASNLATFVALVTPFAEANGLGPLVSVSGLLVRLANYVTPSLWGLFALSCVSVACSCVGAARDHLRVMASLPAWGSRPLPPFLSAPAPDAHGLRRHLQGGPTPARRASRWSASALIAARCPNSICPRDTGAAAAAADEGKDPAHAPVEWELPDVRPCPDSRLIPSFSFVFTFIVAQATFLIYAAFTVAVVAVAVSALVTARSVGTVVVLWLLKRAVELVLACALVRRGAVARPRCFLVCDGLYALFPLSVPSALRRFAVTVAEGAWRSTQLNRPTSRGALARFDTGYKAYQALMHLRYSALFAEGAPPFRGANEKCACCPQADCEPAWAREQALAARPQPPAQAAGGGEGPEATGSAKEVEMAPLAPVGGSIAWEAWAPPPQPRAELAAAPPPLAPPAAPPPPPPHPFPPPPPQPMRVITNPLAAFTMVAAVLAAAPSPASSSPILSLCPVTAPLPLSFDASGLTYALACGGAPPFDVDAAFVAQTTSTLHKSYVLSSSGGATCDTTEASFERSSIFDVLGGSLHSPCTAPPCCFVSNCTRPLCQPLLVASWASASATPTPSPGAAPSPSPAPPVASPSATPAASPGSPAPPAAPPFFPARAQGGCAPAASRMGAGGRLAERCDTTDPRVRWGATVSNPHAAPFTLWALRGADCDAAASGRAFAYVPQHSVGVVRAHTAGAQVSDAPCGASEGAVFGACCIVVQCQAPAGGCAGLGLQWAAAAAPFPPGAAAALGVVGAALLLLLAARFACPARWWKCRGVQGARGWVGLQ